MHIYLSSHAVSGLRIISHAFCPNPNKHANCVEVNSWQFKIHIFQFLTILIISMEGIYQSCLYIQKASFPHCALGLKISAELTSLRKLVMDHWQGSAV